MASALKNKIIRLESRLPREKPAYEFHLNIIVPDETSDEVLTEHRMRHPLKSFTRATDHIRQLRRQTD